MCLGSWPNWCMTVFRRSLWIVVVIVSIMRWMSRETSLNHYIIYKVVSVTSKTVIMGSPFYSGILFLVLLVIFDLFSIATHQNWTIISRCIVIVKKITYDLRQKGRENQKYFDIFLFSVYTCAYFFFTNTLTKKMQVWFITWCVAAWLGVNFL